MEILEFKSSALQETEEIAKGFAQKLKLGDVVLLKGELGAGKTFFISCICEYFGIKDARSPSFKIINIYEGKVKIYHLDFYRIKDKEEIFQLGIDEILNEEAIFFIEWPEIFMDYLKNCWVVEFEFENEDTRKIRIYKNE
ncbi:MAG: tRNA (adenosine(37)-N6)-threonylcarbamoyltransferase complex ATPase subunit type 1 TsaE [Elusimicrobia bacterium]|nr:tRNA (adenosine(37)-N6)-threonylcarbamoyltransferase complex ATPase subunit type 1 TsaE [Elusimicrobiota bacterium]